VPARDEIAPCAFCGKRQDEVRNLVQGPGDVTICDECVGLCAEIVASEASRDLAESCRLVLEDGCARERAIGLGQAVSQLGRDDTAIVALPLADGSHLAVRRAAVATGPRTRAPVESAAPPDGRPPIATGIEDGSRSRSGARTRLRCRSCRSRGRATRRLRAIAAGAAVDR
jgi:hypothetical protein